MRALLIAAAVALVASFAGSSQSSANGAPPEDVSIQAHPVAFFPVELGPWEATGAISDSGMFVRSEGRTSPPDRPFGVPGPFKEVFVFTSLQGTGTFTIKAEERDTGEEVTGVWQIVSGTGAYEDASGHGTVAFSAVPGLFTLSLIGVAKKVGDA